MVVQWYILKIFADQVKSQLFEGIFFQKIKHVIFRLYSSANAHLVYFSVPNEVTCQMYGVCRRSKKQAKYFTFSIRWFFTSYSCRKWGWWNDHHLSWYVSLTPSSCLFISFVKVYIVLESRQNFLYARRTLIHQICHLICSEYFFSKIQ